jgi:hypothetical protein
MTILLVKNSDASHIILATPNKHVGALDLGIELGGFFDTPLVVDTPMGLKIMSINTNDYGSHIQRQASPY